MAVDDKPKPILNKFVQQPRRPSVGPNVGANAGKFMSEREAQAAKETNFVSDYNDLRKRNDSVDKEAV